MNKNAGPLVRLSTLTLARTPVASWRLVFEVARVASYRMTVMLYISAASALTGGRWPVRKYAARHAQTACLRRARWRTPQFHLPATVSSHFPAKALLGEC